MYIAYVVISTIALVHWIIIMYHRRFIFASFKFLRVFLTNKFSGFLKTANLRSSEIPHGIYCVLCNLGAVWLKYRK